MVSPQLLSINYQKRMMQILKGLPGVKCLVDDILVIGRNQIDHHEPLRAWLDRLQEEGITLALKSAYSLFPGLST